MVGHPAISCVTPELPVSGGGRPKMNQLGRIDGSDVPSCRSCEQLIDDVPAKHFAYATDLAVAARPVGLRSATNMMSIDRLPDQPILSPLIDRSTRDAEPGITPELAEEGLEIVGIELEISVELAR